MTASEAMAAAGARSDWAVHISGLRHRWPGAPHDLLNIGEWGVRPAQRVLVLSIPDWGVTPFGQGSGRDTAQVARELDAYNLAAATECAVQGVAFVDITPASRGPGARPDRIADDGLHPSAQAYADWTALALPAAQHLLQF